jgi:hypothetical protein
MMARFGSLIGALALTLLTALPARSETPASDAGSAACADCHEVETKSWSASDHAWALKGRTASISWRRTTPPAPLPNHGSPEAGVFGLGASAGGEASQAALCQSRTRRHGERHWFWKRGSDPGAGLELLKEIDVYVLRGEPWCYAIIQSLSRRTIVQATLVFVNQEWAWSLFFAGRKLKLGVDWRHTGSG